MLCINYQKSEKESFNSTEKIGQRGVWLPWGPIISASVSVASSLFGRGIRKRTRTRKSKKSSAFIEKKII